MFRGRFLLIGLIILLLFGGIAGMGRTAAYREGWMQGYYIGQQADGDGEGTQAAPVAPYGGYGYNGRYHHGWGFSPFWGIGSFLKCILTFLFLGFLFRLFFGWHGPWRHWRHGGWGHGPWKHGWPHGKWDSESVDDTVYKA